MSAGFHVCRFLGISADFWAFLQISGHFCRFHVCRFLPKTAYSYQKLQILTKNCRFLPKTFVQEFWQGAPFGMLPLSRNYGKEAPPGMLPLSRTYGKERPPACSLCPGLMARKLQILTKNCRFHVCRFHVCRFHVCRFSLVSADSA